MSDVDTDALERLVRSLADDLDKCQKAGRARLAENARLRRELAAANDALADVTRLLDEARQQRNKFKTDTERLARRLAGRFEETVALRTRIEWMRPVVEAAEAWRDSFVGETVDHPRNGLKLSTAVDAYRAGQKIPAHGLSATESAEQGEVEVTSADTEQAQRGVQGDGDAVLGIPLRVDPTVPPDQIRIVDSVTGQRLATIVGLATADPPGLEAATEAAEETFRTAFDAWSLNATRPTTYWAGLSEALADAVRAAAPALRAGALREAADDCRNEMFILWLRERADRIGGAT